MLQMTEPNSVQKNEQQSDACATYILVKINARYFFLASL